MITNIFSKYKEWKRKRKNNYFISLFNLPTDGSVLDISCGEGDELSVLHSFRPNLKFFGMDMSKNVIDKIKAKYQWGTFSVAFAESLPYDQGQFEVVLSCMSLHHYSKPLEVFKEVERVLSTQGTFYLIDIIPKYILYQWLCNINGCDEPYHFEKFYREKCIEKLASTAGLRIVGNKKMRKFLPMRMLILKKAIDF